MAVTEQTRTSIIALSVVMLGEAPGTARLSEWVSSVNDGMSLEDLANHIEASDAFQATYPNFSTNQEFAEAFLGSLMGGEDVSAELVAAAVDIVVGLLNDGMTRGALALAAAGALLDIHAQGMDHPAYGDLGMVANGLANQIAVAEHYTLNARMMDPSSGVLSGVTSDDATVMTAIDGIGAVAVEGQSFVLTPTIDDLTGSDADDTFVAQPVQGADGLFNATLNSFDSIDGGAGNDTIHIFGVTPTDTLRLGAENISNVENVVISTVGGVDSDLSHWTGLEGVSLDRFGRDNDVLVTVDGATVSTGQAFGEDVEVEIVGAAGGVDIVVGAKSTVHVGSAGHTGTVAVVGGASVMVDNGVAGKQSETVTSVSVDGLVPAAGGGTTTQPDGYRLQTDFGGYALDPSGTRAVLTANDINGAAIATINGVTFKVASAKNSDGVFELQDAAGNPLTGDHDADGGTTPVATVVFDPRDGKIKWSASGGGTTETNPSAARVGGTKEVDVATTPALTVLSNAIETVNFADTEAIVRVKNDSKDADKKGTPEDLSVTVAEFGGELRLEGAGTSHNVMIDVGDDSDFKLVSGSVKNIMINAGADLELDVDRSTDGTASNSLAMVTIAGAGAVKMDAAGMGKLASIDASGASGDVILTNLEKGLTSYMGGSGFDCIGLSAFAATGVDVDLGAGNDVFKASGGNKHSRIDGGDGMDILQLASAAGTTYMDAARKTHSIYSGFETLDVGRGTGDYDIALLGVDYVEVSKSTAAAATVTLENMADGMGISVSGERGSGPTGRSINNTSVIVHEIAERQPGASRYSGDLEVTLTANGYRDTNGTGDQMGVVNLTLTPDADTGTLEITSNANPHSSATTSAGSRASADDYKNTITVNAVSAPASATASVEEIFVRGNAQLAIVQGTAAGDGSAALSQVELVDATGNSGGVTVDVTSAAAGVEIYGGSGKDDLTGSANNDTISGGGGGDNLTAAAGDNTFEYTSASDSQLGFVTIGGAVISGGYDTIEDWAAGGNNEISVGRGLRNSFEGIIKVDGIPGVTAGTWVLADDTAATLQTFINANADGFFETGTGAGFGGTINHHSVSILESPASTWVFIDVDGDGDLGLVADMVIKLDGTGLGLVIADFVV